MARPTGRYFASVIAKIRDAKKKENIVVDDGFKVRLRQQIMAKIAVQVQPARTSWLERLAPFKSYLAVVPALAFVIVAVVGISKLPIVFKSNTVVPTSNPPQENNTVKPNPEQTAAVNTGTGIKTFPGRLALPPNYFTNNQPVSDNSQPFAPQDLQASVEAPQTAPAQPQQPSGQAPTNNTPAPEQKTTVSAPPIQNSAPAEQPQVQYVSFQQQTETVHIGEGNIQPAPSPAPASDVQPASAPAPTLPSVSGSTPLVLADQTTEAPSVSGSAPSVSAEQILPAGNTSDTALQDTVQNVTPVTEMKSTATLEITPTKTTAFKIQKPTAMPVSEFKLNEIAALPASNLDAEVFYSGNFSNDEKTILEKNIVPYLADGKILDSVNVYQKDPATIAIELNYASGKVVIYHYKVDSDGTWKLIQYTVGTTAR